MASEADISRKAQNRAGGRRGSRPLVLITGAGGGLGGALGRALAKQYTVIGFDLDCGAAECECHSVDMTSDDSVELGLRKLREAHGSSIASVIHLAAYFDFSGEPNALYEAVNEEGTRRLLRALREFQVEQFIYASTMLVHAPGVPGERIDESTPIAPKWAYPESKAATERVIAQERGEIPAVILRLAGLYDEGHAVPTLAQQIARIHERDLKSHLYAGDQQAGQSMVHLEDAIEAFRQAVARRKALAEGAAILIGEPEAMGYQRLQQRLARLIHGDDDWLTVTVPKPVAKAGAWLEEKAEPVIPDAIDQGEKPFIRPFMIEMAEDHYALDITRARELLGWKPRHRLDDVLPALVGALKDDPLGWYRANGVTPPDWLVAADEASDDPEALISGHRARYRAAHADGLWGAFLNLGLASWLITSPPILGYESAAMIWSDVLSGVVLAGLAALSLSARFPLARWGCAVVGLWLLAAPLVFWAPTAASYLNDTLIGMLVIGFAVLVRPAPGVGAVAAEAGPTYPPGWSLTPSSWTQRVPIIVLAFVGFYISRYLAAYQLGHIDAIWEPFFAGTLADRNGTEQIVTSSVSEAWPVSDAGLGALTYALEILTGLVGSSRRWRTMPWLVVLFGILIVPLGAVSITFIIIQPIVIGTWCTLCLVAALAMLVQIPYSLDELVATGQFLLRRKRQGRNLLRVFFRGDTDEANAADDADGEPAEEFARSPGAVVRDVVGGGVNVPWNLALSIAIGVWLLFTRAVFASEGGMADADHLIGALVVTFAVTALAEIARPMRFVNMALGVALIITPFGFGADWLATVNSLVCGAALIVLSIRRGPVRQRYGTWNRVIV